MTPIFSTLTAMVCSWAQVCSWRWRFLTRRAPPSSRPLPTARDLVGQQLLHHIDAESLFADCRRSPGGAAVSGSKGSAVMPQRQANSVGLLVELENDRPARLSLRRHDEGRWRLLLAELRARAGGMAKSPAWRQPAAAARLSRRTRACRASCRRSLVDVGADRLGPSDASGGIAGSSYRESSPLQVPGGAGGIIPRPQPRRRPR